MTFVDIKYQVTATVNDLLALTTPASSTDSVAIAGTSYNTALTTLKSTSTPIVTKAAQMLVALTAGAVTIDLTALTLNGAAVTGNGLKVLLFRIKNRGAAALTFATGASNGHDPLGTGWTFIIPPGAEITYYAGADQGEDIDGTHKTWDVTGTGTDTFELTIGMG